MPSEGKWLHACSHGVITPQQSDAAVACRLQGDRGKRQTFGQSPTRTSTSSGAWMRLAVLALLRYQFIDASS